MEKVFLNNDSELNKAGIYGVNLYTLGVPHTVIVDDYLPLHSSGKTLFAAPGEDHSLWVAVLEKAFAKYYGNYLHIEGGFPEVAIRTLNGGPFLEIHNESTSVEKLWQTLLKHDQHKDLITAASHNGSDTDTDDKGVVLGHAYTVQGVKKLSNGARLVKLRNPWGDDSWKGDYGYNSKKWTPELAAEVTENVKDKNDGYVFMTI